MAAKRRPTMTDVASLANVSQATVSYVVNNVTKYSITDETRAAVERAIAELGYQPNAQARSLASGTSGVVVCVVPPLPLAEPVLRLLGALTVELARRGRTMTVHFERAGDPSFRAMVGALKPEVVFSLFPMAARAGMVDLGTASLADPGCALQVDHLVDMGHTRLGFVGSAEPELARQSGAREASVQRHATARGLPPVRTAVMPPSPDDAAALVRAWHQDGVTAVCANNDEVALGVLRAIRDAGLRCPADVSVVGYDASAVSALSLPALTSIAWDAERAAPLVADLALGLTPTLSPAQVLDAHVVERDSVARR